MKKYGLLAAEYDAACYGDGDSMDQHWPRPILTKVAVIHECFNGVKLPGGTEQSAAAGSIDHGAGQPVSVGRNSRTPPKFCLQLLESSKAAAAPQVPRFAMSTAGHRENLLKVSPPIPGVLIPACTKHFAEGPKWPKFLLLIGVIGLSMLANLGMTTGPDPVSKAGVRVGSNGKDSCTSSTASHKVNDYEKDKIRKLNKNEKTTLSSACF
jgi:hypothetical protein